MGNSSVGHPFVAVASIRHSLAVEHAMKWLKDPAFYVRSMHRDANTAARLKPRAAPDFMDDGFGSQSFSDLKSGMLTDVGFPFRQKRF